MADIDRDNHTVPSDAYWTIAPRSSAYRTPGHVNLTAGVGLPSVRLVDCDLWCKSPALLRTLAHALVREIDGAMVFVDVGAGIEVVRFAPTATHAWINSDHVHVVIDSQEDAEAIALGCLDLADRINEARWRAEQQAVTA